MARLHEYQGKELLRECDIATPAGIVINAPHEARDAAEQLGRRTILKVQAWTTGRADKGGIRFASSPDEAETIATELFALSFGNFPIEQVLIEELIEIERELFISFTIDDAARAPVLLLDATGGTGIEERAASITRIPVDVEDGIETNVLTRCLHEFAIDETIARDIAGAITRAADLMRTVEARSLEINPLVMTGDGHIMAADCRMTIDDYAVFRHPELGIEIARDLDHPPTTLERIAYQVEQNDHRGTFYFAQLPTDESPLTSHDCAGAGSSAKLIGFHGAGGGGSMMSMDAAVNAGFTLANFCDASGNPSAAKVYRAARIILAQPGLVGYFGSGSGVASQEQFWSAYGLAKAFNEVFNHKDLSIPAVIRLGGNSEDRAVEILESACAHLPGPVEGYKKDDTPQFCAERFAELVSESSVMRADRVFTRTLPGVVGSTSAYSFPISGGGGTVWIDHDACDEHISDIIISNAFGLLKVNEAGKPVLAVSEEDVAGKDSELIACEIECLRAGVPGVLFVDLPIEGLDDSS